MVGRCRWRKSLTRAPPSEDSSPGADTRTISGGLTLSHIVDADVAYLLVCGAGCGAPMTLLLPTGTGLPAGLAVFSRLGGLHRCW